MTPNDLRSLLDYHYWARDRMLTAVATLSSEQYTKELGNSFTSVRDTVVHIYSADWVWHQRMNGISPNELINPSVYPDVDSVRNAWEKLEGGVRSYFRQLNQDGINRIVDYRLLSGAAGRSVLWHIVQHKVNHASYHRGQVTTMLRQLGAIPPASTDLIVYHRERTAH